MNQPQQRTKDDLDSMLGRAVEEFLRELDEGKRPDIDTYARENPEIATAIRQTFPAMQMIRDSTSYETDREHGLDLSKSKELGDFRLLQELGAGGMGFVYEAEQLSMGRHVALKILPMAGALQPKSLQRFRNEVRAAAMLDHPNVVSVYSVGENRGVHYYAMQLIRGQSLSEVINALKSSQGTRDTSQGEGAAIEDQTDQISQQRKSTLPNSDSIGEFFRSVALLGIQAANGLAHAHDQGVLHRDVKPANLMLDEDSNLYVTDFGLARIETDAGMTMTGDLVGTLRYMSPEQALAQRGMIDGRSDTYSLGMTLYELLTLRPAFESENRHELLKQIGSDEPSRPRKLNPRIPKELETIVLKAIEKAPEDRYATTQEFAADLKAYLHDRPLRAKPPTLIHRATKWSRRHRLIVATASISFVVLLISTIIILSISNAMILRERNVKAAALEELDVALEAKEKALSEADSNLRESLAAVDTMLTRVSEDDLSMIPEMSPIRTRLLQDALDFYLGFLKQNPDDSEIRFVSAQALGRLLTAYRTTDNHIQGVRVGMHATKLLDELITEQPDDSRYYTALADISSELGFSLCWGFRGKRKSESEPYLRRAAELRHEISRRWPDRPSSIVAGAGFDIALCDVLASKGRRDEAIELLNREICRSRNLSERFPDQIELFPLEGQQLSFLALILQPTDTEEALSVYEQSAVHLRDVLRTHGDIASPTAGSTRQVIHSSTQRRAMFLSKLGRHSEAEAVYRDALSLSDKLLQANPYRAGVLGAHYRTCMGLANVLGEQGDRVEEVRVRRMLWRNMLDFAGRLPRFSGKLVVSTKTLLDSLPPVDRKREHEQIWGRTLDSLRKVSATARANEEGTVASSPNSKTGGIQIDRLSAEVASDNRQMWSEIREETEVEMLNARIASLTDGSDELRTSLIADFVDQFQPRTANGHFTKGSFLVELHDDQRALESYSRSTELDFSNAFTWARRGDTHRRLDMLDEAVADVSQAIKLKPGWYWFHNRLAQLYFQQGRHQLSQSQYVKAVDCSGADLNYQNTVAWSLATSSTDKFRSGRLAIQIARKLCGAGDWTNPKHLSTLAAAYAESGNFDEATRWQRKALELCSDDQHDDLSGRLDRYESGRPLSGGG